MSVPRLFLGESGGNRLLKADDGFQDAGVNISIRAETVPVAPAGAGGEAIFTSVYLVLTATMAVTVQITPIVDEVPLETQDIVLSAQTERKRTHHEFGLSIPYIHNSVERARFAPRGTWFQVRIVVPAIAAGDLIIEGVALEYEIVRESILAEAVP